MSQTIIGVVVFIIIMIIQARKAKMAASKGGQAPHNENFPFPSFDSKEDDEQEEEEEWLGRTVEPKPVDIKKVKLMSEYAAVGTIPNEKIVPKQEFEDFEFDVEKAVIYAEIMAPKYKDYQ